VLQLVDADDPDAHGVDQRVVGVAVLEVDLPADRRHPDAVAVAADAAHDPLEQVAARGQRPEAERVEDRHRPGAHRGDVAKDPADPGGGALVGLDRAGVVVRFDLEHDRPALADVDHAGVLARALDDPRAAARQPAEEGLGGLVGAVLRPEHADHPELDLVGSPPEQVDDHLVFVAREGNFLELLSRQGGGHFPSSPPSPLCGEERVGPPAGLYLFVVGRLSTAAPPNPALPMDGEGKQTGAVTPGLR